MKNISYCPLEKALRKTEEAKLKDLVEGSFQSNFYNTLKIK